MAKRIAIVEDEAAIRENYAAAFRREGERVIAAVEAGGSPFADGWERWRPDVGWRTPALPAGWESLPGADLDLNGRALVGPWGPPPPLRPPVG